MCLSCRRWFKWALFFYAGTVYYAMHWGGSNSHFTVGIINPKVYHTSSSLWTAFFLHGCNIHFKLTANLAQTTEITKREFIWIQCENLRSSLPCLFFIFLKSGLINMFSGCEKGIRLIKVYEKLNHQVKPCHRSFQFVSLSSSTNKSFVN